MNQTDTIAAISTAVSESGIGIIRISGPDALGIAQKVFNGRDQLENVPTHTIHYGFIMEGEETIDEVLVSVFRAPRSFTAEDTVEINCHGGVYAMQRVLELVIRNGARPAGPGEFSKRAFLNGRIDLSQAEAVSDVIQAKNEYALKSSVSQLKGSVHRKISRLRSSILYETARIEAALDDPEHYSLDGYAAELHQKNEEWMSDLRHLIDSADNGRMLQEGIRTAIVGKPNAGKSSLMNAFLGEDRAIVTDIAGTTRDVLTEMIRLGQLTLVLQDTAGIRPTEDKVEHIGVSRARKSLQEADLVIFVADSSVPLDQNDKDIADMIRSEKKETIALLNKSDLTQMTGAGDVRKLFAEADAREEHLLPVIEISAKEETGMDLLEQTILDLFYQGEISFNDEVFITNARQKGNLQEAYRYLENVSKSIDMSMSEDFYFIDLKGAYEALGEITGETVHEDLIIEIFEKFCMGK